MRARSRSRPAGSITALISVGLPEFHRGLLTAPLQLVGRGGIDADAAEGFHHLVVARSP